VARAAHSEEKQIVPQGDIGKAENRLRGGGRVDFAKRGGTIGAQRSTSCEEKSITIRIFVCTHIKLNLT